MKTRKTVYSSELYDIIDKSTGERITEGNSCESFITLEELFSEDENAPQTFQNDITFVKSFRGNGIELNNRLSSTEIATVVFLCDFICYEDCVLRTNGNKRGNPLTIKDLAELKGSNYDTFRRTINSLKQKQVIGFHTTGDSEINNIIEVITVNPYIFCRGTKVEPWIISFYKNTEWGKLVRQSIKSASC